MTNVLISNISCMTQWKVVEGTHPKIFGDQVHSQQQYCCCLWFPLVMMLMGRTLSHTWDWFQFWSFLETFANYAIGLNIGLLTYCSWTEWTWQRLAYRLLMSLQRYFASQDLPWRCDCTLKYGYAPSHLKPAPMCLHGGWSVQLHGEVTSPSSETVQLIWQGEVSVPAHPQMPNQYRV